MVVEQAAKALVVAAQRAWRRAASRARALAGAERVDQQRAARQHRDDQQQHGVLGLAGPTPPATPAAPGSPAAAAPPARLPRGPDPARAAYRPTPPRRAIRPAAGAGACSSAASISCCSAWLSALSLPSEAASAGSSASSVRKLRSRPASDAVIAGAASTGAGLARGFEAAQRRKAAVERGAIGVEILADVGRAQGAHVGVALAADLRIGDERVRADRCGDDCQIDQQPLR